MEDGPWECVPGLALLATLIQTAWNFTARLHVKKTKTVHKSSGNFQFFSDVLETRNTNSEGFWCHDNNNEINQVKGGKY